MKKGFLRVDEDLIKKTRKIRKTSKEQGNLGKPKKNVPQALGAPCGPVGPISLRG